jgi:hypothetical protein
MTHTMARSPYSVPGLSKSALFCDLARARAHHQTVGGSVWAAAAACILTVQLACGVESVELRDGADERSGPSGNGADGEPSSSTANEGESVSPPNTASAEGNAEPPIVPAAGSFDGDGFESPPPLAPPGCKKVDFLFVIDNSFSMTFAQNNLRNSFEGFLGVIRRQVEADDFHIMVVDTDDWEDDDEREDDSGDLCRNVLGAGRRSNGMTGADCGLPGSDRFITLAQPNLIETFSCMATVGAFGNNDEQPIAAMLAANSETQNAAGGCNAGFARRDSVLVVTLITNDEDDVSLGAPPDWLRYILEQKGGEQDALVVLGLLGGASLLDSSSNLGCRFSSLGEAPQLREFVAGLEHGALASVCSDDYSPFFEQAVQSIGRACTDFVPPVIQ